eukprot:143157-Chlamydomonas_euryale.AAC.1
MFTHAWSVRDLRGCATAFTLRGLTGARAQGAGASFFNLPLQPFTLPHPDASSLLHACQPGLPSC